MTTYDKIYAFLTKLRLDEDHDLEWETDEHNQIVIWVEGEEE